jgi:hypothetical protein
MRRVESLTLSAVILSLILSFGCAQMRDYTGVRDGAFGIDVKTGFDQGVDKKDYYLISEEVALIAGDTKNQVIFKIGLPDNTDIGLDGYEQWFYEARGLVLFFRDDRLRGWSPFSI